MGGMAGNVSFSENFEVKESSLFCHERDDRGIVTALALD
jgi:hypothetical protein